HRVSGEDGGHREGRGPCVRGSRPDGRLRKETRHGRYKPHFERGAVCICRVASLSAARQRGTADTRWRHLFSVVVAAVWRGVCVTSVRLCASFVVSVLYGSVI